MKHRVSGPLMKCGGVAGGAQRCGRDPIGILYAVFNENGTPDGENRKTTSAIKKVFQNLTW